MGEESLVLPPGLDVAGSRAAEPTLAAVLWDMDGTLIDTEPHWLTAEQELCAEHGGTWDEALAHDLIGLPLMVSAEHLRARAGIEGTAEEIVETLIERVTTRIADQGIPWRPGARELLHELHARDVPCALVTMSFSEQTDLLIDSLPSGAFATIVTGDRVTHGKPHPEPYLTAMDHLGVDPGTCIAVEDSIPGLTSAEAAGVLTIGVEAIVPIPAAPGRVKLPTLEGLTVAALRQILAAGGDGHLR